MSGYGYPSSGYGGYNQRPDSSGYGYGEYSQHQSDYESQQPQHPDPYAQATGYGYGKAAQQQQQGNYSTQTHQGYGFEQQSQSQQSDPYQSYQQQQQHYQKPQRHHPYKRAEQPHPYQQQPQQQQGLRQLQQHLHLDEPSPDLPAQQLCGQWVFTLALKVPEDSYSRLFGGGHEPERYVPPSRDARWSREATKVMESAPLHPRLPGEAFKVVCDRQQRAIVIASHDKLPDSEMSLQGFQDMLLTLCETLSQTITECAPAETPAGYASYGQQQQPVSHSVCIRYNKGTWLRSFKMHLKADVPVSGYLSLLQQRYRQIPSIDPAEAAAMEARAKSDTKGFRHLLHNTSFCPAQRHPCHGGLHITVPKLVQAGFFCLPAEQQPPGCTGQWWGCSRDSMLVFMPPPPSDLKGRDLEERVGLCSVQQVFEEVARFTDQYMVPPAEGTAEGASTGRGGAGGRMPGFCVCVVPSLQCNA